MQTISKHKIDIKAFSNASNAKELDLVQVAAKSKGSLLNIYVNVFVTEICLPVQKQNIEFANHKYPHLQQLELADSNPGSLPLEIDIFIGNQDYWNFIGVHQVRGLSEPVAISSTLGYVLSEPMVNQCDIVTNTNVAVTHSLKMESEILPAKLLKDNLSECSDVKKKVNSDFALYHFNKATRLKKNRYEVEFPFKETHDTLGDSYLNCKRRLKSLTQKAFLNSPDLLNEYDKIINEQLNLNIIKKVTLIKLLKLIIFHTTL